MNDFLQKNAYVSHHELVDNLFLEYDVENKSKIVSLFLSSLSSGNLKWRSNLSVFAIMQTFPKHKFELRENQELTKISPCAVCSNLVNNDTDIELIEGSYKDEGGLIGHSLLDYFYYTEKSNRADLVQPTKEDFRIFSEILTVLLNAEDKDTVKKTISTKIANIKGFRSNTEQRKVLLEALGYCGILESEKHKGVRSEYINLSVAPRKTHSSDWNYPVDFWLGRDGINTEAFKFWFGEYSELEKFCD